MLDFGNMSAFKDRRRAHFSRETNNDTRSPNRIVAFVDREKSACPPSWSVKGNPQVGMWDGLSALLDDARGEFGE